MLTREDSWVENLTAILFFSASLLLVATTLVERSTFRRCIYALGAIAMVFIAGEEISWGQRILGFATPDLLLNLNSQREFTLHNIGEGILHERELYRYGLIILFTVTSAAFFCQKSTLFGIPLPSMLLMFGFLVGMVYMSSVYLVSSLLLLFVIYALFSRQVQWLIAAVASLTLVLNISVDIGWYEVLEYLFGIACLFYALELWLAQRRTVTTSRAPYRTPAKEHLSSPSNPQDIAPAKMSLVPPWLAVCSFVMVCSIGLAAFQFFKARAAAAEVEEMYQSIVSGKYGKPLIRSTFDAYLIDNQLIYFKEPCSRVDFKTRFFLHLIPADENNLPDDRKQYGFDNLDFNFELYHPSGHFDGKCITRIPLPNYTIAHISTGQFSGKKRLWKAEFSVSR